MNHRQQIVSRETERGSDLRHAIARNKPGLPPTNDRGAGYAQKFAKLDDAASLLDQRVNGQSRHSDDSRTFRRNLSSPLVGYTDTCCREIRQDGDVDLKAIGRRVRKLREDAGEVQEDLAAAAEVTRQTIAGIERGKDQGGLKTMVAIADHYRVPLDWLLCRKVPPGGPPVGKLLERPDQIIWSDFWDSLTDAEQSAVMSLLRIPLPHEAA